MSRHFDLRRVAVAFACVVAFAPVFTRVAAQAPAAATTQAPKPITLDDYAHFKRIAGASISNDGKWMLYTVTPNDGDGTLFVKSLDAATVHEIARGTGASFSDTSKWVGYFVAPPTPARGRAASA